jgi:hypothetical protein
LSRPNFKTIKIILAIKDAMYYNNLASNAMKVRTIKHKKPCKLLKQKVKQGLNFKNKTTV